MKASPAETGLYFGLDLDIPGKDKMETIELSFPAWGLVAIRFASCVFAVNNLI